MSFWPLTHVTDLIMAVPSSPLHNLSEDQKLPPDLTHAQFLAVEVDGHSARSAVSVGQRARTLHRPLSPFSEDPASAPQLGRQPSKRLAALTQRHWTAASSLFLTAGLSFVLVLAFFLLQRPTSLTAKSTSRALAFMAGHHYRGVGGGGGFAAGLVAPVRSGLMGFWASYNRSLKQSPLLTKIATGVVGTILGDGLAQYSQYRFSKPTQPLARKLHERSFQYDHARLLRLLFWSAAVGTPIAHFWFQFLDMRIMPGAPTSPLAVVCKLVLDQGLMAPLGTALFFMGMKVLEGQPHRALPEVKEKLWPVMLANWAVWPLANAINFAIIPPSQRILYVNVLAVVWTAFMSHMANKPAVSAAPSTSLTASSTVARSSSGHKQGIAMLALEPASDVDGKHL